jgi:hypothetical protein
MKRKFYLTEGFIFADLIAIQIQDYDRETDKFWIIERSGKSDIHISKNLQRHTYFDTWEDAWGELRRRAWKDIKNKQESALRARHTATEIGKMTKPNYRPVGER